ncbi:MULTISPECIES: hypothetical protein [Rufibacter]|uniref:Uncharacterized protein n=1 Tax=Rufibacter quisquiliarum TaxID=1549639 RepID=A0A839GPN3_9BACT|nr:MULTISPECIES: hypothetical protein [Rufibacter]MBA9078749.1 hypothetical protein [Rufibacter quisquiliarum]
MADHKDKDSILHLYNQILPKLAERIYQNLTEVFPLFDDFRLEKMADTWTKDKTNPTDKEISLENGNVAQIGLRLQLLGFHRAGADAFDLAKDLLFKLEHTSYTVGPSPDKTWLEKLYFEPWSSAELTDIASRWSEEVVDDLTQQLQQQG